MHMEIPKISIIVPIYKVEKYLERCIETLINQSIKNIEIILINDGSPDNSSEICDKYALTDLRIKVIHKENEGLGLARNTGLEVATGTYIAFVDSDDYVDINMYKKLAEYADKHHCDAVFCNFYTEINNGKWRNSSEVSDYELWEKSKIHSFMLDMIASKPHEKLERKYQMSVWHAIYKHTIIDKKNIRFLSERVVVSEDIPFQVDFLSASNRIGYIPNAYYYYCKNDNSLTKNFLTEKYDRFKNLRNHLLMKNSTIEYKQRVNKLFIGYCRSYITELINSNQNNKKGILNIIVKDPIWETIKREYKSSYLPIYSRIYYKIILSKNSRILLIYSSFINLIKKIRK